MTTRRDRKPEALQKGVPRSRCGSGQSGWRGWGRPGRAAPRSALGRWEGDDGIQAGGGGSWRRREERVDHPAHPEPLRGRVRPHHRGEPGADAGAASPQGSALRAARKESLGRVRVTAQAPCASDRYGFGDSSLCEAWEQKSSLNYSPPHAVRRGKEQQLV